MTKQKAVLLLSGGMDSTTLAYDVKRMGHHIIALSVHYGQRHVRELKAANEIAQLLGAEQHIVDLTTLKNLLPGSALTDDNVSVPRGHYAAPTMKSTVVPNRNAIMLTIAFGVAAAHGAQMVATAVHAGDHAIYPDCRPNFIAAFQQMEVQSLGEMFDCPALYAPFLYIGKHDIARIGASLKVPYELTWSCYEGGDVHCGQCGTCVERKEAFELAGLKDPTKYLA